MVMMQSHTVRAVVAPRPGVAAHLQDTELGFATALALLSRFKQLMAQDGTSVDSLRMLADTAYAAEQLEWAHTSTLEPLRHCAMSVFGLLHD